MSRVGGHVGVVVLALLYAASVHYGYVEFVNPLFEYAQYRYLPFSSVSLAYTYVLICLPLVGYRPSGALSNGGAALLFVLTYIPCQLMLLFSLRRESAPLEMVQLLLCIGMMLLFLAARVGAVPDSQQRRPQVNLDWPLGILTLVAVSSVVAVNYGHMRIVSFTDVYALRFEASEVGGTWSDYMTMWLSYCFIPYFYARGMAQRRLLPILFSLVASVVVYAATGAKAVALMFPMVIGVMLLWGNGRHFLPRLLASTSAFVLAVITFLPSEGLGLIAKSIVLVRTICSAGWALARYTEYFTANGYTYYTHVGPVNALTGAYPHGDLSLGQLIGVSYSGSSDSNFNASFWASDGIAAVGIGGVLFASLLVAVVYVVANRAVKMVDPRFVMGWMTGFWIAMLNLPITTALLSGGGVLVLLLVWLCRRPVLIGVRGSRRHRLA